MLLKAWILLKAWVLLIAGVMLNAGLVLKAGVLLMIRHEILVSHSASISSVGSCIMYCLVTVRRRGNVIVVEKALLLGLGSISAMSRPLLGKTRSITRNPRVRIRI